MDGFQRSRQTYQPLPTDEGLNRGPKGFFQKSILAEYGRKIQSAPREIILSRNLLLSCVMYATAAIPLSKSISRVVVSQVPRSPYIEHSTQHGIRVLHPRCPLCKGSSSILGSVRSRLARRAISSLWCILVMRSGLHCRSSSMIGLGV